MYDRINLYGEPTASAPSDRTTPAATVAGPMRRSFDSLLRRSSRHPRPLGPRRGASAQQPDRAHPGAHGSPKGAVSKAAAKGARESLILLDDLALVVSVKNRTVITAIAPDRIRENVFTNIDSAVIG